jgi:hypothetical protein
MLLLPLQNSDLGIRNNKTSRIREQRIIISKNVLYHHHHHLLRATEYLSSQSQCLPGAVNAQHIGVSEGGYGEFAAEHHTDIINNTIIILANQSYMGVP